MNNTASALKGFVLGLAILICGYSFAGGVYPPQGGGGGASVDLGALDGDLIPATDSTYTVGDTTAAWSDVRADLITAVAGAPDREAVRLDGGLTAVTFYDGALPSNPTIGLGYNDAGVLYLDDGEIAGTPSSPANAGIDFMGASAASTTSVKSGGTNGLLTIGTSGATTGGTLAVDTIRGSTTTGYLTSGQDLLPNGDSTYDLGSSTWAWAEVHVDNVLFGANAIINSGAASRIDFEEADATAADIGVRNIVMNEGGTAFQSGGNRFYLDSNSATLGSSDEFGWTSSTNAAGTHDTFLGRDSAGVTRFGATTGQTDGGIALRETVTGGTATLTDGVATEVFSITTGDGDMAGVVVFYVVQSTDGTEYQSETGTVTISLVDDAGGVVASTPGEVSAQALSSGTLTTTWAVTTTDDQSIEVTLSADTSLTPTTHQVKWTLVRSDNVTLTVP